MRTHHDRPMLEALEHRCVPALLLTLNSAGELITISGQTDEKLALLFTANNAVDVFEAATFIDNKPVGVKLVVALGDTSSATAALRVSLNGFKLDGDLSITLGNAVNGFDVDIGGGDFGGDLLLKSGKGADILHLGGLNGGATVTGAVKLNMGTLHDEVEIDDCFLNGSLTVRGTQKFTLDNASVVGLLHVDARSEARDVGCFLEANSILFSGMQVFTSVFSDSVQLNGTIHGTARVVLGNGDDELIVNNASIDGLFANGGAGADTFTTSAPIDFPVEIRNFLI